MGLEIEEGSEITAVATGDSMISRRLSVYSEDEYLAMVKVIRDADVAFTNLEGMIHNYEGYPNKPGTRGAYMAVPHYTAEDLKWMGFKMVSIANNHVMDYSEESLLAGMKLLDKSGIVYSGAGRDLAEARLPAYLETNKGRVALISIANPPRLLEMASYAAPGVRGRPGVNGIRFETTYVVDRDTFEELKRISSMLKLRPRKYFEKSIPYRETEEDEFIFVNERFKVGDKPGVYMSANKADVEANLREIRGARREADLVLVSYHAHEGAIEDPEMPAPFVRKFTQKCIDAGADVIVCHGDHRGRGVEIYKGKPIFHSLGTFIMQTETLTRHPSDAYEKVGLDPAKATRADFTDTKFRWWPDYPPPLWFKAILAAFTLRDGNLVELKLYPIDSRHDRPRGQRGRPMFTDEKIGMEILERYKKLSEPFGTEIVFKKGIGLVKL